MAPPKLLKVLLLLALCALAPTFAEGKKKKNTALVQRRAYAPAPAPAPLAAAMRQGRALLAGAQPDAPTDMRNCTVLRAAMQPWERLFSRAATLAAAPQTNPRSPVRPPRRFTAHARARC
jgi:hypothetical protein